MTRAAIAAAFMTLFVLTVVLARMANLHDPKAGVNEGLAVAAVVCGVVANVGQIALLIYLLAEALAYRG